MATTYILGRFRLDAEAAILFRGAAPVALGQRAVALLRVLVERPGIPVSKDALIEAAWPGLSVEESNLTVQISALRRAFDEEPGGKGWIETLPRRGYRFVGPVSVTEEDTTVEPLPIAVLPFANSSGDPDQQYFADGLTEDIITDLSRVSALFVVSRNTVFALKEKHLPVREMARQLNVDYILEGSVRTAENRVRITAQLVDAGTGGQMWADRYDRRLEGIFALQDEISRSIVGALEVRLLPTEAATLARRPTTMTEAYQFYLKGRSHFLRGGRSRRALRLAQQMFGKAIEVDSRYARAYAGLANCDSYLLCLGDPDVTFEQILTNSERALALEPNLAEAHAARGLALYMSGNHEEADVVLERAMQLGPSLFEAHYFAGRNHQARGLYEQAAALFEKASQIEPDDYSALGLAVATNRSLGREDAMRSVAARCLERVEAEIAIHPDHAGALAFGASVQAELGDKIVAGAWADRAAALDPDNAIVNYNVACTYAALGRLDAALDHLQRVFAAPSPNWRFHFEWMKYDSSLDPVRSHPGYGALLERLEPEARIDPGRGDRFVGPVSAEDGGAIAAGPPAPTLPPAAVAPGLALPNQPSIAVLPFQNMSGDPEQEYFADGISEDIITELSRFHALFVIARNSSFAFKDKTIKVQDIGRELGVAYVVEGSVRRAADRVRITAQLIDAGTGDHLWAERYDRDLRDIFTLQDEVARSVASTVSGRVEAAGRDRAVRLSPTALKAHDLLFRAKALTSKYTRADNEEARACAERAVELDPTNAGAHAHQAWCNLYSFMACWAADREAALAKAYQAAQRAVVLDETDSLAHGMLGIMHLFRREYDESRLEVETAIALNPNDFFARRAYGHFLAVTGQADAAIEQFDLGKRLNPFDTRWVPWFRGVACFTARRYEEAIASLKQARDPINEVRGWLAASYAQAGRLPEARATLEEFLRVAESDMAVYPGRRLKDWEPYWHGTCEYRDQKDFDHLFEALRKAGMEE